MAAVYSAQPRNRKKRLPLAHDLGEEVSLVHTFRMALATFSALNLKHFFYIGTRLR
jgi:hypothetical protein